MKTFSKTFSGLLFAFLAIVASVESQDYVTIDTGYRWDKISNRVILGGATIPAKGATQLIRDINSYQLGAKGQWSFCDCAFVRGQGHYGWVFAGGYKEGGFFGNAEGYTYDLQGAVGYSFCLTPSIAFSPLVGWGFDAINVKGTDIHTAIDGHTYRLHDINAHQQFMGPLIGFDLVFNVNDCTNFTFGYEFHYGHWHGDRNIQGKEYGNPPFGATTGFSNTREINQVYGQVFKLDLDYQFCDCWTAGLGLKYQFYQGDSGDYKRTKTPLIPQYSYAKVKGLWWSSFASTITIGRAF